MAIGRKNYLFMGSDNGVKAAALLYGVRASDKAKQVEPIAYVRGWSSYRNIRRLRPQRYRQPLVWRRSRISPVLVALGDGIAEKLIFDE